MAFKPLNTQAIDIKDKIDQPFVGTYTGRKDITTKIGPQIIWLFTDEMDQPFGIYSFTMLTKAMEMVTLGSLVRITYKGKKNVMTSKFGLKDVHQCLVELNSDEDETKVPF